MKLSKPTRPSNLDVELTDENWELTLRKWHKWLSHIESIYFIKQSEGYWNQYARIIVYAKYCI